MTQGPRIQPQPTLVPPGFSEAKITTFYEAIRDAGIDFAAFLPDSVLDPVAQMMLQRDEIPTYQCSREDEGIAMAMGAYLVGKKPIAIMEGSGIGLSALILARGVAQHSATLILASHSSALGEAFDYHSATRLVSEPVLRALGIPCVTLDSTSDVKTVLHQACLTMQGQQIPVGVLVPPFMLREL